ncbi:MAG: hypothetical protein ACYTGY_09945 [Planctomycetota bacterium]|jgi:hypothetical protein
MRRTLLTTLLLTCVLLAGCGPRESQARSRAKTRAERPDQSAVEPAPPVAVAELPAPEPPSPPAAPADPMIAAMAQAHIEGLMADYQTLMNQVEEMRSTMQNYRARRGRAWSPDLSSSSPWQELIRARLLWREPVNPFSPPGVGAHLHVVQEPGVAGESISPKTAGWVWNSADEVLDVARDSAAIRACQREKKRRYVRETIGPYLDPRLELMRAQISLYQLYESDHLWKPGEVAREQWSPLINAGYVSAAPQNPMTPQDRCTSIVEITEAGASGKAVDPASAGWVWNSADRKLYAAGYDG